MTDRQDYRSWWSTALISFFGGMFGGFLWIGAGRLAVVSLAVVAAGIVFFCYYGFPALPNIAWLAIYWGFAFNLLSVAIVLPFRTRFKPDKWYSSGYSVLGLGFLSSYAAAFLIRSFLFQPFSMPSTSMEPALQPGDYLFVSKFAYGYGPYSLPLPILPAQGRLFGTEPRRGDIVAFKRPSDSGLVDYVKRVVGMPGDTVQMVDGTLRINGVAVLRERIGSYSSAENPDATLERETLPEGRTYMVLDLMPDSILDNTQPLEVPPGHFFALGDNRDNSLDSRSSVGMVPYENLVGKAVRLFWNANGTEYKSRQVLD